MVVGALVLVAGIISAFTEDPDDDHTGPSEPEPIVAQVKVGSGGTGNSVSPDG